VDKTATEANVEQQGSSSGSEPASSGIAAAVEPSMSVCAAFLPSGNAALLAQLLSRPRRLFKSPVPRSVATNIASSTPSSSQGCFLSYAQACRRAATTNCVIPTAGNPQRVVYLLPSTDEIISFVPNAYFTGYHKHRHV
jgi:hypothetical protein